MKTWLITGCSSGIGKGIAKAVLESGDQAIVTARNKDKVMDIVEAYPETALAISLDVCSQDNIKNAVKEAYDKFGTIDVLVNNAGYGYRSAVEEGEIEAVQTLYQTNLFGPIELIKAVLPKMREQKSGYILNVTSIAAARSAVGSGYYASSKAALELLTNGLMKELAPLGIKAMVVQPGAFRTRFYDGESLQGTKAQIGDYEAVVGKSRPGNFENKHQQAGDPDKAGKVIVDVVHNDDLPEILTLGKAAVTAVKSTLEAKIAELDKWAEVSASCDYDEGGLLGFTAQQTLDYAQSLYEKRLITYPRTDSRFLTEDMAASLPGLVTDTGRAFAVEEPIPIHVQQVIDGSKVTDHHALLPTKSMAKADLAALPAGERNVLRLIAARLLCAVGEPYCYAETTLPTICAGEKFTAKGKVVLSEGWEAMERKMLGELLGKQKEVAALPDVQEQSQCSVAGAELKEGQTTSPKHFTDVICYHRG